MMGADIHHRTEDFRKVYRACLAGLKEVMGTANDVMLFSASGTGAMDASVSNLFSKGDKVIVCVAGKFGERWLEIVKAYELDAAAITVPYGGAVAPKQLEEALAKMPDARGVFVQARRKARRARRRTDVEGDGPPRWRRRTRSWWWMRSRVWARCRLDIDVGGGFDVVISGSCRRRS